MNGFKQQPQATRKERLRELEAELQNMQMALRVSQLMTQQLLQSNKAMTEDLGRALGLINELQYKFLAIQKVANLDVVALNDAANDQRLKDFNEASDAEDKEKDYQVTSTICDNSVVILTSTVEGDKDKGLFRSKIGIEEAGATIKQALMGKMVGDKVEVELNGEKHLIEILGVRQPQEQAEAVG